MLIFSFSGPPPDVGGADTTVVLLRAFVLAMVLYPEAQRKAQHEIEGVVGNDRLPSIQE
jgi:Cytochrome P450